MIYPITVLCYLDPMFYTDVFVEKNKLFVRGYDNNGKRFQKTVSYRPYLHKLSNQDQPYKDIHGRNLEKIYFDKMTDAKAAYREGVSRYENTKMRPSGGDTSALLFGLDNFSYQYIHDTYPFPIQYDTDKIKVGSFDIEVESDKGFPHPDEAKYPITAITIGTRKVQVTIGCGDYTPKLENHTYIKADNEIDLILIFMKVWEKFDFDVISGWNIEFFDIPYMVNRMKILFDDDIWKGLSPWKRVYERVVFSKKFNEEKRTYDLRGLAVLDYQNLYKTFPHSPQESYSLNNIAYAELGEKKLDYSEYESLNELYLKDYEKFIDYNLRDNLLIFKLDDELGLINQTFAIAYDSGVNYADALTSVRLWEVIIYHYLMDKNIIVPPKLSSNKNRKILGGYVKEPVPGKYNWIVSFDFTSLYPHLIMMFNISPDTFLENVRLSQLYRPEFCVDMILNNQNDVRSDIREITEKNNSIIVPLGLSYERDKLGFLPILMEKMYDDRAAWKNVMLEEKTKIVEIENELRRRKVEFDEDH